MEHPLVDKLRKLLDKGVDSEAEAVYLLVGVRKLVEELGQKDRYEYLMFFCDWVVHAKMDRSMAKRVLCMFDELQQAANGDLPKGQFDFSGLGAFVVGHRFREQLEAVLHGHGLPTELCNGPTWPSFLNLYAAIITDCPLTMSSAGKRPKTVPTAPVPKPQFVSEVVVRVMPNEPSPGRFTVHWRVSFAREPNLAIDIKVDMANSKLLTPLSADCGFTF